MGEQKQPATGVKDEKANKPMANDQKPTVTETSTAADAPAGKSLGEKSTAVASMSVDVPPTKMQSATEIYKRMRSEKDVTRKDIIEKFIVDVKLTKAGASTYYQMIKANHEPMGKK